jgi:glutamine amidotransferase
MNKRITVVDHGIGNIRSVKNALDYLGFESYLSNSPDQLLDSDVVLLPGVGHFGSVMNALEERGLTEVLHSYLSAERPLVGICVGMQMMGNRSDEGTSEGLKWIDADILKFDESLIQQRTKLPHMGWNDVSPIDGHPLFEGLEQEAIFYFLHSYYFKCNNIVDSIAISDYGIPFTSAVNVDNVYGIQFHPEKSHQYGEKLLHNFAKL